MLYLFIWHLANASEIFCGAFYFFVIAIIVFGLFAASIYLAFSLYCLQLKLSTFTLVSVIFVENLSAIFVYTTVFFHFTPPFSTSNRFLFTLRPPHSAPIFFCLIVLHLFETLSIFLFLFSLFILWNFVNCFFNINDPPITPIFILQPSPFYPLSDIFEMASDSQVCLISSIFYCSYGEIFAYTLIHVLIDMGEN